MSERDELREEMCHLAHALGDVRVELVRATEVIRSLSEVATKCDLKEMEGRIMATQAEVVAELQTLKGQVAKVKAEVLDAKAELQDTIKKLEELIASGNTGNASAELVTIKDELKAEFQTLDDLHLDKLPPV